MKNGNRIAPLAAKELQEHIAGTYFSLGIGMVLFAFLLPVLLVVGGLVMDAGSDGSPPVRPSMSDYYNSPMRDVFVGTLIATGAFLVLYRGIRTAEDWALNLAGVCAVGTALVPTGLDLHGAFAISFFVFVAYVCLFRAEDTVGLIKQTSRQMRYKLLYRILGLLMVAFPSSLQCWRRCCGSPYGSWL